VRSFGWGSIRFQTASCWRRAKFSRTSWRWPPTKKGRSRSRWSTRVITSRDCAGRCRKIDRLAGGRCFGKGQGGDVGDAEVLQQAAEMGGVLAPLQLLLEGPRHRRDLGLALPLRGGSARLSHALPAALHPPRAGLTDTSVDIAVVDVRDIADAAAISRTERRAMQARHTISSPPRC
jgi:hypothetical protein